MKYLQFNRETEQTSPRVVRLAFTSRLAHQTRHNPSKLTPARDRLTGAGTRDALEMQRNCWFGHTTSSTPHLIPNCEVKSGQATSSTALGDYAGTGCAERFLFLAAPAFLPVAREEFQSAPAVFRSGEPSAGVVGQNRKNEEHTAVAESAWE
ncbi:Hypothetical_protein [Hexamita inflata]|uniref:Hypothetical_protein n=1 Tax=Hexamita inflata TaxID=28002 RepID=A0AA86NIG0_9EUKA|nr:Hypothetical protein HINF_LOCUS7528 [Hexamita inflata]